MNAPLRPVHPSILANGPRTPYGLSKVSMPRDARQLIDEIALDVFTSMVNAGHTFQAALSAVYFTGVENALSAKKDQQ